MLRVKFKYILLGLVLGTIGITTVFASNGIKSLTLNNVKVTLDGAVLPLNNSLVSIQTDGEIDAKLYMPARETLEYLGYRVEFDGNTNTLILNSPENGIKLPEAAPRAELPPSSRNKNDIPEHFTSGGFVTAAQDAGAYTYEGIIGPGEYQRSHPFPVNETENVSFKLNLLEYVSGGEMSKDEAILRVILEDVNAGNNRLGFDFNIGSLDGNPASFPADSTDDYSLSILNYTDKEVKYSFTVTVKNLGSSANGATPTNNGIKEKPVSIPETPKTPKADSTKADSANLMRKYYDDDSEIVKAAKNVYFENCRGEGNQFTFDIFVGCTSIYEFDLKEAAELAIDFQSNITKGKFKLVLVTPDNQVITVSETVTPESTDMQTTLNLAKGKNTLKIVGLDASGDYTLKLSGAGAKNAKPIGLS